MTIQKIVKRTNSNFYFYVYLKYKFLVEVFIAKIKFWDQKTSFGIIFKQIKKNQQN